MPEIKTVPFVLVFPTCGNGIWLAEKVRKIGVGRLNGYGGNIEPGESLLQALSREVFEECQLKIAENRFEKVAVVNMYNVDKEGNPVLYRVHVFMVELTTEEVPIESPEMLRPTLYPKNSVPVERLMPSDQKWFPRLLEGKKFIVTGHYGAGQKELIGELDIQSVEELPQ